MALIAARINIEPLSKEIFSSFFLSLFCCCVWRGEFCLFVCLFDCLFCFVLFVFLFICSSLHRLFLYLNCVCYIVAGICDASLRCFLLFSIVMLEMRSFWCQFCVSVRRWYSLHRVRPKSARTVPGITWALTEFFGRLQIDSHRRRHHRNIL